MNGTFFVGLRKTSPARGIGDDSARVRLGDINDAGRVWAKSCF
jgi:hypothetical protein